MGLVDDDGVGEDGSEEGPGVGRWARGLCAPEQDKEGRFDDYDQASDSERMERVVRREEVWVGAKVRRCEGAKVPSKVSPQFPLPSSPPSPFPFPSYLPVMTWPSHQANCAVSAVVASGLRLGGSFSMCGDTSMPNTVTGVRPPEPPEPAADDDEDEDDDIL